MPDIRKAKKKKQEKMYYIGVNETSSKRLNLLVDGLKRHQYDCVTRTSVVRLMIDKLDLQTVLSMLES